MCEYSAICYISVCVCVFANANKSFNGQHIINLCINCIINVVAGGKAGINTYFVYAYGIPYVSNACWYNGFADVVNFVQCKNHLMSSPIALQ